MWVAWAAVRSTYMSSAEQDLGCLTLCVTRRAPVKRSFPEVMSRTSLAALVFRKPQWQDHLSRTCAGAHAARVHKTPNGHHLQWKSHIMSVGIHVQWTSSSYTSCSLDITSIGHQLHWTSFPLEIISIGYHVYWTWFFWTWCPINMCSVLDDVNRTTYPSEIVLIVL